MAVERETAIELSTVVTWLVSGGVTVLLGILAYLAKNAMDTIKQAIDNMSNIVGELKESVDLLKEFASRQDEKNNKFNSFEKNFEAALNRVNKAIAEKINDVKTGFSEKIDDSKKSIDDLWTDIDKLYTASNENTNAINELKKIHEYCKNNRKV